MFGDYSYPSYLDEGSRAGFREVGRGAVFLWLEKERAVSVYVTRQWITSSIDDDSVKRKLLKAIDRYDPKNQAIVMSSYDNLSTSDTFTYRWFKIDFRKFKDVLGQYPPISVVRQPSFI